MTLAFTALAFICIDKQYFGELPWIAVMISCAWTAYGVSQGFYYNKAKKEN
jgi:EamA domain-containing membrane protein RarD